MESLLSYYYGIVVNNIKKKDEYYIIEASDGKYLFAELFGSIENVEKIIDLLNKTNIKYHLLALTKDNKLFITYDEKNYCLLKIRCDLNHKVSLLTFSKTKTTGACNWNDIWSKRIDYYEEQIEEVIKDKSIKYAIQYYIGLTEIAIYGFNSLKEKFSNDNLVYTISHKKITSPCNPLDYYNPLNMIIDLEIRDLAEYLKASFFNETLTDYELLTLIDNTKFTDVMANFLFIRLLYPSYFFYLYDEYVETKKIDDKIFLCIKKSKEYESLLSKIYSRLSLNNKLYLRPWFIKSLHL